MNYENDFEINYEDMDDLALCDHIEWNHLQAEAFPLETPDNNHD